MPRLTITLPEKIYKQIKTRAEKNLRTISNQIAYELQHPDILPKPEQPVFIPHNTPGGMSVPDTTQTVFTSPENPTGQNHTPTADTKPTGDPIATITEMERYMSDPDNEYYQKIKNYFLYRDKYPERLVRLLNLAEENNLNVIAGEFEYAVQKALDIPITKSISRSEWKEIITYLK